MKNKNYIIIGAIVLVVILLITLLLLTLLPFQRNVVVEPYPVEEPEIIEEDPQIIQIPQEVVTISNSVFSPREITISIGTMIIWTNNDSDQHTIISSIGNEFTSVPLSQGDSFSHVFTRLGEYEYYCSLHPDMRGKIIVVE